MSESKPKTAQDVYEVVRQLSSDERERLEVLMDNDDNSGWASPEIKQAWMEEIERREQLYREGKNPDIPWEEARENVLEHLDRLRQ
jgi:putative addiction module component (TIGR02574 family)